MPISALAAKVTVDPDVEHGTVKIEGGAGERAEGTEVTVTAEPDNGWRFAGFSANPRSEGVYKLDADSKAIGEITFKMRDFDVQVGAKFVAAKPFDVAELEPGRDIYYDRESSRLIINPRVTDHETHAALREVEGLDLNEDGDYICFLSWPNMLTDPDNPLYILEVRGWGDYLYEPGVEIPLYIYDKQAPDVPEGLTGVAPTTAGGKGRVTGLPADTTGLFYSYTPEDSDTQVVAPLTADMELAPGNYWVYYRGADTEYETVSVDGEDILSVTYYEDGNGRELVIPEYGEFSLTVIDGGFSGSYAAGEEVDILASVGYGRRFLRWQASSQPAGFTLSAQQQKAEEFTLVMPRCNVTLTAISEDVTEADYLGFDRTALTLKPSDTATLDLLVMPDYDAVHDGLTVKSSNPRVAKIEKGWLNGEEIYVVTAVGAGRASITATDASGARSAACAVTVSESGAGVPATAVTFTKGDSYSVLTFNEAWLEVKLTPANSTDQITYTSSNEGLLNCYSNHHGICTIYALPKKAGVTYPAHVTVTATASSGASASIDVAIYEDDGKHHSMDIAQDKVSLSVGERVQLWGNAMPDTMYGEWESDAPSVVAVDENGVVTGVRPGRATIAVNAFYWEDDANGANQKREGGSASCVVTVTGGGSDGDRDDGGSTPSGNPASADTVKNPDGSTTVTTKQSDGSATTATTAADGSVSTTKTDAAGKLASAEVTISEQALSKALGEKGFVTAPVEVKAADRAVNAPPIKLTVPEREQSTLVKIPVENMTKGTVAILVDENGNERILKSSLAAEDSVLLWVTGPVTVKIVDNSVLMPNVSEDAWYYEYFQYTAPHEIPLGTASDGAFDPNQTTSYGDMVKYLRDFALDGGDSKMSTGTSDWSADALAQMQELGLLGSDPKASSPRAVTAELLRRCAKELGCDTTPTGDFSQFSDSDQIPPELRDSMRWIVGVELMNGMGDGTLNPMGDTTDAQSAKLFTKFVNDVITGARKK